VKQRAAFCASRSGVGIFDDVAGFPIAVMEANAVGEPLGQGCICSMEKGMI